MPLINIDTDKEVDWIPGRREVDILRGRLSTAEFDAMVGRIDELIDEAGSEIAAAGWLPVSDWRSTEFQPIYDQSGARGLHPVGDVRRSACGTGASSCSSSG